jgi:ATP-dependent Lon protease
MAETSFEMTPEPRLSLPVLPLKNTVVYPELVLPLTVGRTKSLAALKAAADANQRLITVAQRDPSHEEPDRADLYDIGTIVAVKRIERRDGGAQVIVQGEGRVRILDTMREDPHLEVEFVRLPDLSLNETDPDAPRIQAMVRENLDLARRIAQLWDEENGEQVFQQLVGSISDPVLQMFRIASLAQLDLEREQQVLEVENTLGLMEKLHEVLSHEFNVNELRREIAQQAKTDIDRQQREHLLRQQKHAIEQALGEAEGGSEDIGELREQLAKAKLPEAVQKEADRELKRLARMSENAADYQVARSYLELTSKTEFWKVWRLCN